MIINSSSLFETKSLALNRWTHRYSFSICKSIDYLWFDDLMADLIISMFEFFSKNQFHHPLLLSIWLHCYMWSCHHSFLVHIVLWLQCFRMWAYLVVVFYFYFLNIGPVHIDFYFLNHLIHHLNLFVHCFLTE